MLALRQTRVTYWLTPARRVTLLTVFPKTRSAETAEVARALHAQKIREAEHGTAAADRCAGHERVATMTR